MWIPKSVFDLFTVNVDQFQQLKQDIEVLKSENALLKSQLASAQNHFDWLRLRVNTLEVERGQLIEKAYGIKIPVPEIVRRPLNPVELNADIFNDMGDEAAKALGFPAYDGK